MLSVPTAPADWEKFRRVRNQYTEKIREASSTYRANLASKLKGERLGSNSVPLERLVNLDQ